MKETTKTEAEKQAEEKMQEIEKAFLEEAEKYPGAAFSRKGFSNFSDYSVGYLANLDSKGEGPDGGFYTGRKRQYLKKPSIEWLIKRLTIECPEV